MEHTQRRRRAVFFTADLILLLTSITFTHYNYLNGVLLLGTIELLGCIVYGALAVLVLRKRRLIRLASWVLVVVTTGFMLYAVSFLHLHITNLIWLIVPYFLSMFLLGLRSGIIVSALFFAGIVVAMAVRYTTGADALPLINRIGIITANLFAFLFAAYYEKERSENERELREKNREIEIMSHHDGLTGLFNRRYFDLALTKEFHRSKREHQPLALIILDIDLFKNYNDSLGHLQGDTCLKDVADIISISITRTTDTATRYGGEEFAVLLPNTNQKGAQKVAERIQNAMADKAIPHPMSEVDRFVTLSLGVAVLSQDEDQEPSDLVSRADRALYASKSGGRNQITVA